MNTNPELYDMMDRFLDRATTPDEDREFFDVLLRDEELSTEFQAQAQMRSIMDHDVAETLVPPDLYATIVESARQASLLPVPVIGAASIATEWIVRTMMTVAAITSTAVAGIATTAILSTLQPSTSTTVGRGPATPPPSIAVPVTVQSEHPQPTRHALPVATVTSAQQHESVESVHVTDIAERPTPITSVVAMAAPESEILAPSATNDGVPHALQELSDPLMPMQTRMALPLQLRFTQTPITYHMYATHADLTSAPNLGLEVEYAISSEHAVGAVLHNDVFPVNVVNADGTTEQRYTMVWAGGSYRFTPSLALPLGMQPFAQISAGGSSRGVVAQPTLGMQMNVGQLSISAGANVMTLFYQNNGSWNAAGRVGMLVGIGLHL